MIINLSFKMRLENISCITASKKIKPTESKGGSSHPIGKERVSEDDITVSGGGIGQLQVVF